jgi:serine/threonine protein kinase
MYNAVMTKFTQDPTLKALLMSTAAGGTPRMIIEHTDKDNYWSDGGVPYWCPGQFGNKLGQLLVRIRDEIYHHQLQGAGRGYALPMPPANHQLPPPPPQDARAAGPMCTWCRSKPCAAGHQYCGRTCGKTASAARLCAPPARDARASASGVTRAGLDGFRQASPGVQILVLGSQVSRADLITLLRQFMQSYLLDLTSKAFQRVTADGLRELFQVCPGFTRLRVLYFTDKLQERAANALTEMHSRCPSAYFVQVGDEIKTAARATAIEAKKKLDEMQKQLRSALDPAAVSACARDTARTEFITAAEAFSKSLLHLLDADHPLPEHEAWCRVRVQAEQLGGFADECKRVLDAGEPMRSTDALRVLNATGEELRQEVEKNRALIVPLRIDLESSTARPGGGEDELVRTQIAPEVRQARADLLAQPMEEWSEVQVQDWIALINLPAERLEVVQRALAKDETDGEDLKGMARLFREDGTVKPLQKILKKVQVQDAVALAQQTLELHEVAQGEAPAQKQLAAAQAQLAAARKALRENSLAAREAVVELVSLATRHFPELLTLEDDVKAFMDSDGLLQSGRQLTDYDERRTLVIGRSKLLVAKINGVEVVLKEFIVQADMSGYMKEITNVQRLRHRHIIRYNGVFHHDGSMYIEMEYCKQGSLTQWIRDANPDERQKQSVLRQVLSALACMHEEKIVHCDLKGDNVLIAVDGTARICDFEMSKSIGSTVSSLAGGTRGFMAPELHMPDGKPSAASDMYAYGVLVLNTLHPPAEGQPYPQLNAGVITNPALSWVQLLMDDNPEQRLTAVKLQAEPYFDISSTRDLPECASVALARATERARSESERAVPKLLQEFRRYGDGDCTETDVREAMQFFANAAALHLNFDPFKNIDGKPLLQLYVDDTSGRYKTLFETGIGGGSLNLDARRAWERRMYGTTYDGHDTDRPKYGNVNFLARVTGDTSAAQYGKSYLLLNREVRARCTITSLDSSRDDAQLGTLEHCAHVLLHKIKKCPSGKRQDLVTVLCQLSKAAEPEAMKAIETSLEALRTDRIEYMELQIHGDVDFKLDTTMAVVAEGATVSAPGERTKRLDLPSADQARLWRAFAKRFGVQAVRMSGPAMVPLG